MQLVFCGGGTSPTGQAFDIDGGETITSYDLLAGCQSAGFNYNNVPAQIQAQDTVHDVASLEPQNANTATTPSPGNALPLQTSAPLEGERVELLGDVPGTSATVAGRITTTSTTLTRPNGPPIQSAIMVQLPSTVSDGEVGGPAIDAAGAVVGVVIDVTAEIAWLAPASAIKAPLATFRIRGVYGPSATPLLGEQPRRRQAVAWLRLSESSDQRPGLSTVRWWLLSPRSGHAAGVETAADLGEGESRRRPAGTGMLTNAFAESTRAPRPAAAADAGSDDRRLLAVGGKRPARVA